MIFYEHSESDFQSDFQSDFHEDVFDFFSEYKKEMPYDFSCDLENCSTENLKEKIDVPEDGMVNIEKDLENNNEPKSISSIVKKYGPNINKILGVGNSIADNIPKENIQSLNNNLLSNKTKRTKQTTNNNNFYNKRQKCGRKTEKESDDVHDEFKADNIIRKIKIHILQDKIINLINDYLKNKKLKKKKLFKLLPEEIECLKRDKNLIFMNLTLKDIYRNNPIGEKYNNNKSMNNQILIDEIYTRNDLIELQKLLNLTFFEFYQIYTYRVTGKELSEDLCNKMNDIAIFNEVYFKGIKSFIEELAEKQKKKGISEDDVNRYINEVKKVIGEYKEFFENKKGRSPKKSKQQRKKVC